MNVPFSSTYPPTPDQPFLQTTGDSYTYGELYRFQHGLFQYLKSTAPDNESYRVLLTADSSKFAVFTIAACWNLGITVIPLSPRQYSEYSSSELASLDPTHRFVAPDQTQPNIDDRPLTPSFFKELMKHELPPPSNREKKSDPEEYFGIFHSSGTTGNPKTIPLKRRQLNYGTKCSAQFLQPESGKLWLLCLPPYHIGGTAVILRSLLFGCGMYLQPAFDEDETGELISSHRRIEAASLVPTMLKRLLNQSSFTPHSSFQGILLGGGPMPSTLIEQANRRGVPLVKSYGMTETCAQITALPIPTSETHEDISGSVGHIFSPNEIQIRDSDQNILPSFESGLIWLRGPQVFDGYKSKNTEAVPFDTEGWFNTGDYGYVDAEGRLYIEMRRTDRIVSGGKNINPYKIENVLHKWDRIREVAVVGLPDNEWGEKVTAFIVPTVEEPELNTQKVNDYLKDKLAGYEIPKLVRLRDHLPRTPVGKIKRDQLKDEGGK